MEEEEERLWKRKEQLKLDEEIAAHMTKLNVFKSLSTVSQRTSVSKHTDGMNSYLVKGQEPLSVKAKPFVPQSSQYEINYTYLCTGTRSKKGNPSQLIHSHEPISNAEHHGIPEVTQMRYGNALKEHTTDF